MSMVPKVTQLNSSLDVNPLHSSQGSNEVKCIARIAIRDILCVDDNPMNQKLMSKALSSDYNFTLAKNGAEAVEFATKQHFRLVMMDAEMPIMNGADAALAILKLDKEVHIVVQTTLKGAEYTKFFNNVFSDPDYKTDYEKRFSKLPDGKFVKFDQIKPYLKKLNIESNSKVIAEIGLVNLTIDG